MIYQLRRWWIALAFVIFSCLMADSSAADDVFIFSTVDSIRGVNLTQQAEYFLTSSPFASGLNALAVNTKTGLVYYGSGTTVYRWNPALGTGAGSHTQINDFSSGALQAPIQNINSTAGSFLDGKWYVGSETSQGYIEDIYELTMSSDGRSVVAVRPLDLLGACNCSGVQIGGFGDIAAVYEGSSVVIYGSSADLTNGSGTSAGRWKFDVTNQNWAFLAAGAGGQMSHSQTGLLYSNVGTSIRTVDKVTGATGSNSLFTVSQGIYDFTSGFTFDFSDAVGSYGAAFHNQAQSPGAIFLGATPPDNEPGVLNTASGSSDISGDDVTGIDDEDAVGVLPVLTASASDYSISLACSTGAYLSAWIDLDLDGTFDAAERNTNYPLTCVAGQAVLSWNNLAGATTGESFLRIRTSSDRPAIASPTGLAPDGEVEDHPIQIVQPVLSSCPAGSTSEIFKAADLPKNIGPNANTITRSTIPVSLVGNIIDVNVLDMSGLHYAVRDLIIDLEHETTTTRLYGPTCNRRNHFNISFDDESSGSPPCPPTNGQSYPPSGSLSDFDGHSASGDWVLNILDRRSSNSGRLDSWSLELCTAPPVTEQPELILGKSAIVSDRDVTVTLVARNSGDVDLDSVRLLDDLDVTFGVGNYQLIGVPDLVASPAGYIIDNTFSGSPPNTNLLAGDGVLSPDAEVRIVLSVAVGMLNNTGQTESYFNQADVSGISPQGVSVSDLSGDGLDTQVDQDQPTPILLSPAVVSLSGTVFFDTSDNLATSHDGVKQNGEDGDSARSVQIINTATGQIVGETQTDSSGNWSLEIDALYNNQPLVVAVVENTATQFISESVVHTAGSVVDGLLAFTPLPGIAVVGLDVGIIAAPRLTLNQSASAPLGSHQVYPHRYWSPTHGAVTFTLTVQENPSVPAWSSRLIVDENCNEMIDPGEQSFAGALTVSKEQTVCLLIDAFVPVNTVGGAVQQAILEATIAPADVANTGHGLQILSINTDVTTVTATGAGRLVLDKTVRNVSSAGAEVVANSAKPGDTIEYTIHYSNEGSGPISDLVINDYAPAYTDVVGASVECVTTPSSMGCVPAVAGDALEWGFSGSLEAGSSGSVRYSVSIE